MVKCCARVFCCNLLIVPFPSSLVSPEIQNIAQFVVFFISSKQNRKIIHKILNNLCTWNFHRKSSLEISSFCNERKLVSHMTGFKRWKNKEIKTETLLNNGVIWPWRKRRNRLAFFTVKSVNQNPKTYPGRNFREGVFIGFSWKGPKIRNLYKQGSRWKLSYQITM